jgi:pimeloyl-CoA synthetase
MSPCFLDVTQCNYGLVPCSEVRTAIMELKNGKIPGEDGILNEFIKLGIEEIISPITRLFNLILDTEEVPKQWNLSTIILLHKKGPKDDLNNYRPISLMPDLYKLFFENNYDETN